MAFIYLTIFNNVSIKIKLLMLREWIEWDTFLGGDLQYIYLYIDECIYMYVNSTEE